MGQERSGKRKHLFLCIACCLSLSLWLCGCVPSLRQWQGEQALREAKDLRSEGDYSASEKKTLGVLEDFPQTLGDEALFQLGLLYAFPKNPKADYEKSRAYFEKLLTLYPQSSRKEEAAAWVPVLDKIIGHEKETSEFQKKTKQFEQLAETRGKKLKQLQDELDSREKEITEQHDAVRQLQNRVNELESQLAKFKSIDLSIEKKKRATTP
jgi:hypothetical protein